MIHLNTRSALQSMRVSLIGAAMFSSIASAKETSEVPRAFVVCAAIATPEERLACFDTAMRVVGPPKVRHAPPGRVATDNVTLVPERTIPAPYGTMTKHGAPEPQTGRQAPVPATARTRSPRVLMEVSGGLSLASIDEVFTADILNATTNVRLNSIFGGRGASVAASLLFPDALPWGLGIGIDYQFQHIAGDAAADLPDGIQILNDPISTEIDFTAQSHALSVGVSVDSGWQPGHQVHAGIGIGVNWNILEVTTRLSSPAIGNDAVSRDRITDIAPSWHLSGGYRYLVSDHMHLSLSTRISGIPGDLYGAEGRSALLVSVLAGGGFRF